MCRKLGCDTAAVALGSGHALMQCRQLGHVLGLCSCEPVVHGGEFGNVPIEALSKNPDLFSGRGEIASKRIGSFPLMVESLFPLDPQGLRDRQSGL